MNESNFFLLVPFVLVLLKLPLVDGSPVEQGAENLPDVVAAVAVAVAVAVVGEPFGRRATSQRAASEAKRCELVTTNVVLLPRFARKPF